MFRPRMGWKPRVGILAAILLVAVAATRFEKKQMAASAAGAAARVDGPTRVSAERLMQDVQALSSPELEGRLTGSPGNHKAQAFILRRFGALGLKAIVPTPDGAGSTFRQEFRDAANLMGSIEGSAELARFTTVTAHYDHLGVRDGVVYPGADDNASGVAAMLAAAEYFTQHRPRRSMLFIAFDGEEEGLQGSRYFVAHAPVPLRAIVLEVNLDMVARGDRNELVVAGTYYSPALKGPVAAAARGRSLALLFGHDRPGIARGAMEDWTHSSDHGPFHDAGIPFLYFGVEDHADYHRPTDTADKIPRTFFLNAANLIVDTLLALDAR